MPKNFVDIVLDELETEEENPIYLEESFTFFTPFLAYAVLKNKAFNRLSKAGKFFRKLKEIPTKLKAKALGAKEEIKATLGAEGKSKEDTVYKPTPEQKRIMREIYQKHGDSIIKDIRNFRNKILSRYQLAKRLIRKSSIVGSKESLGMTFDQFQSALESGRKKIEARGEHFDGVGGSRKKLDELTDRIDGLQELKKDFEGGGVPRYNIANKVYRAFEVADEDLEGYSREELRRSYDTLTSAHAKIKDEYKRLKAKEDLTSADFEKSTSAMIRAREARKAIDLTNDPQFKVRGDFNVALGRYFLSKSIWNELTKSGSLNVYRKTYLSIIDEMIKKAKNQKKRSFSGLVKRKRSVALTSREKKIWVLRPTGKEFSSDLGDYFQKITADQFGDTPIRIKRSPELDKLMKETEALIKRETRKISRKIPKEDYQKLRKFRLINNLITVKELENPKNLFKTAQELEQKPAEKPADEDGYVSKDQFFRKIKEIATIEYDTISELKNAKREAKELSKRLIDQGDKDIVDEYKDILRQIELRRSTSKQELVGRETEEEGIIDIDDVERLAKKIIDTTYTSVDTPKQDWARLNKLINKYKETDPEAERNLDEIGFLIKKATTKLERPLFKR